MAYLPMKALTKSRLVTGCRQAPTAKALSANPGMLSEGLDDLGAVSGGELRQVILEVHQRRVTLERVFLLGLVEARDRLSLCRIVAHAEEALRIEQHGAAIFQWVLVRTMPLQGTQGLVSLRVVEIVSEVASDWGKRTELGGSGMVAEGKEDQWSCLWQSAAAQPSDFALTVSQT